RAHLHPSLVVDGEEPRAPVPYAVEFDAVLDGPAVHQRLPFLQYLDAPGEHAPKKVASTPIRVCRLEHARGRDEDGVSSTNAASRPGRQSECAAAASPRRGPIPRPQCGCLARGNRSRRRTAVPEGRRASRRAWRIRRCSEAAPTRDCPTGQRTRGVSREASEKTSPSKCEEGDLNPQAVVKNLRDSRTGRGENG